MLTPTETLVRRYLSLGDIDKVTIAKKIGAYDNSFNHLPSITRDKEIFKLVKTKGLLQAMADALGLDIDLKGPSLEQIIIQIRNEIK